jgi:RNA polymerase sigma-70 factor (ECF subfamily)
VSIVPPRSEELLPASEEAGFRTDFDAALTEHRSALFAYLQRRLGDREAAADLVQETYVHAMRHGHTEEIAEPRAWLFRIAHNLAVDYQIAQRRRYALHHVSIDDVEPLPADQASVETIVGAQQTIEVVIRRILIDLPHKCALAFALSRFEGLTNKQVAAKLHISEKMVEKYITRALIACRVAVGDRPS